MKSFDGKQASELTAYAVLNLNYKSKYFEVPSKQILDSDMLTRFGAKGAWQTKILYIYVITIF